MSSPKASLSLGSALQSGKSTVWDANWPGGQHNTKKAFSRTYLGDLLILRVDRQGPSSGWGGRRFVSFRARRAVLQLGELLGAELVCLRDKEKMREAEGLVLVTR